jgi:hypothetical protein
MKANACKIELLPELFAPIRNKRLSWTLMSTPDRALYPSIRKRRSLRIAASQGGYCRGKKTKVVRHPLTLHLAFDLLLPATREHSETVIPALLPLLRAGVASS